MGEVAGVLGDRTVAGRLAVHARQRPDALVIDDDIGALTYGELDQQVDRVAGWLHDRLGPGASHVGILADHGRSTVLVSMAASRAGLVSVGIDPSYPDERRDAVVVDAELALIVTDRLDPVGLGLTCPVVGLDEAMTGRPIAAPVAVDPDSLSAILYTSGSTGTPKGVMMSHLARIGVCESLPTDASGPGVRCGVIDSGSSGSAEGVLCIPVVMGGCLVPFEVNRLGMDALPAWLREQRVTAFRGVPSILRNLLVALGAEGRLPDLTSVATFGEQLQWVDVDRLLAVLGPGAVVHNTYGSSEAGIVTSLAVRADRSPASGPVPVGVPLPGRRVEIVDDDGMPLERGDIGAVVAVGGSMPIGYWKRPELDAELFGSRADGTRTCRTGDRGHLDEDGALHLAGRADDIVKIGGTRVDLGEVESVLAQVDGVAAAAVAARPDRHDDLRLLAYVVAQPGRVPEPLAVRAALARRLPRSMLPDLVSVLDELPRLPGGKVDRAALPDRPAVEAAAADQAGDHDPRDDHDLTEAIVQDIFAEVLDLSPDAVHADDDFFELGGDSRRALHVVVAIDQRLSTDLQTSALVEAPTAARLAALIRNHDDSDEWTCLLPVRVRGNRPPLFVFHDGAGSVMGARPLAQHLGPDQPVYAVQQIERAGRCGSATTFEELAATYVDAIREVAPEGPYLFFGHSLGGVIAFEAARQIAASGGHVGFVALGDSPEPGRPLPRSAAPSMPTVVQRRRAAVRDLPLHRQAEAAVVGAGHLALGRIRRLRRRVRKFWDVRQVQRIMASGSAAPPRIRRLLAVERNKEMSTRYRGGPFDGSVVYFCEVGRPAVAPAGWTAIVSRPIRVVPLAVHHRWILQPAGVVDVAKALQQETDAILAPRHRATEPA